MSSKSRPQSCSLCSLGSLCSGQCCNLRIQRGWRRTPAQTLPYTICRQIVMRCILCSEACSLPKPRNSHLRAKWDWSKFRQKWQSAKTNFMNSCLRSLCFRYCTDCTTPKQMILKIGNKEASLLYLLSLLDLLSLHLHWNVDWQWWKQDETGQKQSWQTKCRRWGASPRLLPCRMCEDKCPHINAWHIT